MANDYEGLIVPGILVGGLVVIAIFKDQVLEAIDSLGGLIPKGNGDGNDDGDDTCSTPCKTGYKCVNKKCVKKTGSDKDPKPPPPPTGSWYKASGTIKSMPNRRCDGNSNRWENEVNWGNLPGYEVVVYFTVPKGSMQSGSHIGLKHGGPNHTSPCDFKTSGGCCCWWDTGLRRDGKVYVEVEHPHPSNIHTKYYGNIGRPIDNGQPLGIRWHMMKEGSGVRLKQWVDTSGKVGANRWKQTYDILDTFNGSLMPSDYKSKAFTNLQNIEIRISDIPCKSIKMNYGPYSRQITRSSFAYNLGARLSNVS